MTRQITVEVAGDASKFKAATKDAVESTHKFGSAIQGVAMGAGIAAFNMAAGAVQNFIGQLGSAGDQFREDEVSQQRLANVMKNVYGPNYTHMIAATEEFAAAQARLGFQDDDVRNSMGLLVGVTKNLRQAMQDEQLAQDLARSKGIDLATATDVIAKAQQGNGKALKSYGIDLSSVHTTTTKLITVHTAHGDVLKKVTVHLTQAQLAAQYLDAVQKNVKGSAEAYANTAAGKLAAANAKNAESWERIGSIVSAIQAVVLPLVAAAFEKVSNFVINNLVPAFAQIQAVAMQIWKAFMDLLAPAIDYIKNNFDSIKPVLIALAVVVGVIVGVIVLAILAVVAVVVGLVAAFIWLSKKNEENLHKLRGQWDGLVGFVRGLPGRISGAAKGMWDGIWNAFRSILNRIIGAWNGLHFTVPSILGSPSFTVNTPDLPLFDNGGVVPGTGHMLGILKGGEEVLTESQRRGGGAIHIHMHGMVIDGPAMDRFFAEGLRRARFAPGT